MSSSRVRQILQQGYCSQLEGRRIIESDNSKDLDCAMSEDALSDSGNKSVSSNHSNPSFKSKKFVPLDSSEQDAVQRICKVLNHRKVYLICRIVKYAGIDKAMDLLKMTEDIEENGGMMILNNARRRTPSGVYIQLLKNDKDITQEIQNKVFEGEIPPKEMKYYKQKRKRKNRFKAGKVSNKSKGSGMSGGGIDVGSSSLGMMSSPGMNLSGSLRMSRSMAADHMMGNAALALGMTGSSLGFHSPRGMGRSGTSMMGSSSVMGRTSMNGMGRDASYLGSGSLSRSFDGFDRHSDSYSSSSLSDTVLSGNDKFADDGDGIPYKLPSGLHGIGKGFGINRQPMQFNITQLLQLAVSERQI